MIGMNRGVYMPHSRKKEERDHGRKSLLKNRVVDLKAFRRHKNAKSRQERHFNYRTLLYALALALAFLSIACGILGFVILPFRAQLILLSVFFAVIGFVVGLIMCALLDRRARKVLSYLCIGLLLAFVAGIIKLGF